MTNRNATFTTLGSSAHTPEERQKDDFYATDPIASKFLLELEELSDTIIDNSYGQGHLMEYFIKSGKKIIGYDIINRTNDNNIIIQDWLSVTEIDKNADIVFNPPYKMAQKFVEHSLKLVEDGRKVCAFLRLQFLESKSRRKLFKNYPPKTIYVSSSRINCYKDGNFERYDKSAVCYCWFVWEKGYQGETTVKWFN